MRLIDLLQPEFIKYPLVASSKIEVIKELLTLLAEHQRIWNPEKILNAILEREKILSTGLGNGVAIPHCRSNAVQEFSLALGIHPRGVEFQSLDHKPSHIIFLLVGPETEAGFHLRLLSRISRIISKPEVRESILASHSVPEIHRILQNQEAEFFEVAS